MSRLIIGVGFRDRATAQSIEDAIATALRGAAGAEVVAIATAADKIRHPALLTAAGQRALPIVAIDPLRLRDADPQVTTRSPISLAQRGVGSVCEAAALAAAGRDAQLVVSRVVSADQHATAAAARLQEPSQ
uniref:Cobalamin biosynthesis protein G CbiG n=1 Tax=Rhodopseudomonas palustris (strain BisA53) TaxID=316055 RepID=Q07PH2_RHOP5